MMLGTLQAVLLWLWSAARIAALLFGVGVLLVIFFIVLFGLWHACRTKCCVGCRRNYLPENSTASDRKTYCSEWCETTGLMVEYGEATRELWKVVDSASS